MDELSKQPKLEWQEYIRGGVTYHQMIPYAQGITLEIKKIFGQSVPHLMSFYQGNTLYWYYVAKELFDLGEIVVAKLMGDQETKINFFTAWDNDCLVLNELIKVNSLEKIKILSDQQLFNVYQQIFNLLVKWCGSSMAIDATDESLMTDIPNRIKTILKQQLGAEYQEKEFIRVYNILTSPSNLSYLNEEREALLHLAQDLETNKITIGDQEYQQRIKMMLEKFWWTNLGWAQSESKTEQDILNSLEEIKNSKTDINHELDKIKNYRTEIKAQKDALEERYNFQQDKQLVQLLELFDQLVEYHDKRKEMQMKENFWHWSVFAEIAKRKKIAASLLDWCELEEIGQFLLDNKFNQAELKNRTSNFLYLNYDGVITTESGASAIKNHQKILDLQSKQVNDLQGISASAGKVLGPAFVAITIDSAKGIKEGQILVTGMTTPDFVPAMKKAAAIVTDEGGITCHAAIISRELGIPCIVGTKLATRLIKTGDIIEVAANHGIVRIIK